MYGMWAWGDNDVSVEVHQLLTNIPPLGGGIIREAMNVGSRGIWEISVPSPRFCCESKLALKIY